MASPQSGAECFSWASRCLKQLSERGLNEYGLNLCARFIENFKNTSVSSCFSGIGGAEEACRQIMLAAKEHSQDEITVHFSQAVEIDPACQDIISARTSCSAECLFADVKGMAPPKLRFRLESEPQVPLNASADATATSIGDQVAGIFQEWESESEAAVVSHCCLLHPFSGQACTATPTPSGGKRLRVHVAGVECTDYSRMGLRAGLKGSTCPAFMAWIAARMASKEDLIIVECVTAFPDDALQVMLGAEYTLHTLTLNPTQVGWPCNRHRKYMLLFRHSLWQVDSALGASLQAAYMTLFAVPLELDAQAVLRSSSEEIMIHRQRTAAGRSMPVKRSRSQGWSSYQTLSPPLRRRVNEYPCCRKPP
eukprot:1138308-Amphidinium_carterae.1